MHPETKALAAAFTLVELLLVVGLVGLLLIWATPQFSTFNRRQTLQAVADQVVTDLKEIQNLAMSGVKAELAQRYLFSTASAPAGRGYRLCRNSCEDTVLKSVTPSGPVCVKGTLFSTFGFEVPTGRLVDSSGSGIDTATVEVCYPNNEDVGKVVITVKPGGGIEPQVKREVCSCS